MPKNFRVMTEALDRSPEAVLAYSDFIVINPAGERSVKSPMRGSPTVDDLLDHGWAIFWRKNNLLALYQLAIISKNSR